MRTYLYLIAAAISLSFSSCLNDDDPEFPIVEPPVENSGLFIVCNGQYGVGNASLSFYNPSQNSYLNNIFQSANGMKLGDVAQSMSVYGNTGWICVNNSNVIFAIDAKTYREKGRIENIASPRYFLQVSPSKAYVTHLYSNRISIVNPSTYSVTGYIEIPGMEATTGSTEQIIAADGYIYVNCWSYQKSIIKIDPATDRIVATAEVGIQPQSMAYDKTGNKLYVLCDGGWDGNPLGYEAPSIHAISLASFSETSSVTLTKGVMASDLQYHDGHLYWLSGGVQRMSVSAATAPEEPFIESSSWGLYALYVNPGDGYIYVGDAIDYEQPGKVYRYNPQGEMTQSFVVGVAPRNFCWYNAAD